MQKGTDVMRLTIRQVDLKLHPKQSRSFSKKSGVNDKDQDDDNIANNEQPMSLQQYDTSTSIQILLAFPLKKTEK
ncbi:UPF0231 protein [Dirofilaria immitis]